MIALKKDELIEQFAGERTTCVPKGCDVGGRGDSKMDTALKREHFYGIQHRDPTRTFSEQKFAQLKAHLGESGYPRTAREAMQQSFAVREARKAA